MSHLHEKGYPVPAVEDVSADGADLVMERVDGPSLVEAIGRAPWTVRRQARVLAELHQQLHELPPAQFLRPAPLGAGASVLHLDLHPLNVIIGRSGPRVIDWTGASVGDPDLDVALAWILMAAGEIPGHKVKAALLGWGRRLLVDGFLAPFDRDRIAGKLRSVVELKVQDPHMRAAEVANMWRTVERAERGH